MISLWQGWSTVFKIRSISTRIRFSMTYGFIKNIQFFNQRKLARVKNIKFSNQRKLALVGMNWMISKDYLTNSRVMESTNVEGKDHGTYGTYWVTQKLPQICLVIVCIRVGEIAWFAVYICGNFCVTQYTRW